MKATSTTENYFEILRLISIMLLLGHSVLYCSCLVPKQVAVNYSALLHLNETINLYQLNFPEFYGVHLSVRIIFFTFLTRAYFVPFQ